MAKVELDVPEFRKPPRSKPADPNNKKIKQVAKGKTREQRLSKKLRDSFIPEDIQDVKTYLIFDTIIPHVKETVLDLINMAFYGESYGGGRRNSKRGYFTNERTSYASYYKSDRDREKRERSRKSNDIPEIIVESRADGLDVIEEMNNLIDEYDSVSVGDLNQIVGITGNYQDEKFGWYDISSAKVKRVGPEEYLIDLPRPKPLD